MKTVLLLLLLTMGVHGIMDAQEAITLDQRFQLHYSQWRAGQDVSSNATRGTYDFNVGIPILTYRLGALALSGDVDYEHQASSGDSTGSLGLNRYGLKATLFPYLPLHLGFDYTRTQIPGVAGIGSLTGDSYGVDLGYQSRWVQNLNISFRRGNDALGGSQEGWSIWKMAAHQNISGTQVSMEATHQDFGSSEGLNWRRSDLYASTDTSFSRAWALRTNLQADESVGSRTLDTNLSLTGTPDHWSSVSSLSLSDNQGAGMGSRSTMLSQSLALNGNRASVFSSAALSSVQIQGGQGNTDRGTLMLGGAYRLGKGWRASLDFSESFGKMPQDLSGGGGASQQNLKTFHTGISEGGDLPGIIGRTLFYLSERRFQRSVVEDYAPGYVPSELAAEIVRRRFRESGNFDFAGDYFHTQAEGGPSRLDWIRLSGQVRLNAGWSFQILGDWKRDEGLAVPGARVASKNISLNGIYSFGESRVLANIGYSANEQSKLSWKEFPDPMLPQNLPQAAEGSRYLSLGFNSRFWLVPYGLQWTKYEDAMQAPTKAFSGFFMLNFRKVNLRVSYQSMSRGVGFHENRINVDLLRWFDTISFGGFRP